MPATTKLEAINTMLSVIGEAPVNTLTNSNSADVEIAQSILDEVLRELCSEEWHFNTEEDYSLAPDIEGKIAIPSNAMYVDVERDGQSTIDGVERSGYLYNRKGQTFVFTQAVKMSVRWLLGFEELPQPARTYVIKRAGRIFADRVQAAPTIHSFSIDDEFNARARLEQFEADAVDTFAHDDPYTQYGINRNTF